MRLLRLSVAPENPDNYVAFLHFHLLKSSGGVKEKTFGGHIWLTVTSVLEGRNVPLVCELKSKNAESERQHICVTRRDAEYCVWDWAMGTSPMLHPLSPLLSN